MQCTQPYHSPQDQKDYPCYKCPACKAQQAKEKAKRAMDELLYHNSAVMVTLTYDEKHLAELNEKHRREHESNPQKYPLLIDSLDRREVTNYMRRVKRYFYRKYGIKLTYTYGSEYGSELYTHRPHYHIIIYGLKTEHARELHALWGKDVFDVGFKVSPLRNQKGAEYVSKYIQKNLDNYYWKLKHPYKKRPFFGAGNGYRKDGDIKRTGIGYQWAKDNAQQLKTNKKMTMSGIPVTIPEYYKETAGVQFTAEDSQKIIDEKERQLKETQDRFYQKNQRKMTWTEYNDAYIASEKQKRINRIARLSLYDPKYMMEQRQAHQESLKRLVHLNKKAEAENQNWKDHFQDMAARKNEPTEKKVLATDRVNGTMPMVTLPQKEASYG